MSHKKTLNLIIKVPSYLFLLLFITACSQAYYGALEKVGIHKRDIMVDRVQEAKQSQEDAKEQFQSALEEFSSVANFQGGDLEDTYKKLNKELQKSEARADEVTARIDSVEDVSIALFKEWEQELSQYESAKLRTQSEQQLKDTKVRYEQLMAAMRLAESRIEPVLRPFRDQVLFLKHNLNAKAIASLRGELIQVESDTDKLIKELEISISEADRFIQETGI
ncbi:MAG: DUF2959 domain-containing protein [Gammaproteobacteria bacterium]